MSYQAIMNEKTRSVLDTAISTKILQHMDRIRNASHEGQARRWIWELIQNAKDCAYVGQPVKIKIELFPDKLIFSHNGRPFGVKNLLSIINQVSSKLPEHEETTGKFGTGFVTTHLLSEKVTLSSIIQDFDVGTGVRLAMKGFTVELDRSGTNQEDILDAVKRAIDVIETLDDTPDVFPDLEEYNTSFTYSLLTEHSRNIAHIGLRDLDSSLSYAMAFVSGIAEIQLIDHVGNVRKDMKRNQEQKWGDSNLSTFTLLVNANGIARHHHLLLARQGKLTIAMPIDATGRRFLPIPSKLPRIFSDFPLIGSETFPFPIVCNHSEFKPDELRSSIPITNLESSSDSHENKVILQQAMLLYKELLFNASAAAYKDFFNVCSFPQIPERPDLEKNWITEEVFHKMYQYMQEVPMILKPNGLTTLQEGLFFPISPDEQEIERLWHILSKVKNLQLPVLSDVTKWYDAFSTYAPIMEGNTIPLKQLTVNTDQYGLIPSCTTLNFVQMVYDAVLENFTLAKELSSGNLALFPDQTPEMTLRTCIEVFEDPGIDEPIKKAIIELNNIDFIIDNQKYPIYEQLVHPDFELRSLSTVREAPVTTYLQYIRKKCDTSIRVAQPTTHSEIYDEHRMKAVGHLISCYSDEFWLELYRKFLDPTTDLVHLPSELAQDTYWHAGICLVIEKVAELIQDCKTMQKFQGTYYPELLLDEVTENLSSFLQKSWKITNTIYDYKVFPNQYDRFLDAKSLSNDQEIDEDLKRLTTLLVHENVPDYYELQLSKKIPQLEYLSVVSKTNEHIARDISRGINAIFNHGNLADSHDMTKEACTLLLAWMDEHDELAEELFAEFYSDENRMKLLTPKSAAILNRKVQGYQKLLTDYGLSSIEDLEHLLKENKKKSKAVGEVPEHVFQNEDIFIDFHEFPELFDLDRKGREDYAKKVGNAGELYAMNYLLKKWESAGYERIKSNDPKIVVLRNSDQEVQLHQPDTMFYKQAGWDISETINQQAPTYYEVKATVSAKRRDSICLSHTQADLAFTLGDNYCILRYFLSVDLSKVISCSKITNMVEDLKAKQLHFTGSELSLWLNPEFSTELELNNEETTPLDS